MIRRFMRDDYHPILLWLLNEFITDARDLFRLAGRTPTAKTKGTQWKM
jgi:hypothetical protein